MNSESKITESYFQTTSGRAGEISPEYYQKVESGLLRRMGGWVPKAGDQVLDLGCGLGGLLYLSQRLGCGPLTGVNLCLEEISIAQKYVSASFHHEDVICYLQHSTECFDWIGCLNLLEHLSKDQVVELLRLCREHLRPGGVMVAMVPNAISPYSGITRYWDFTHQLAFTPNNFRQLAILCDFYKVEFKECGPIPHSMISTMRWLFWQATRIAIKIRLLAETADSKEGIYTMDMLVRLSSRK